MPTNAFTRLQQKRAKLETELNALRSLEEEEEKRKALIVGRAVLAHAAADPAFHEQLARILANAISRKRERKLFDLPAPARPQRSAPAASAPGDS